MSHTVLVCDDAIFMRTMISDILAQAGFEIVGEAEIIYMLEDGELKGKETKGGRNNG